jgi:hypothetical protein
MCHYTLGEQGCRGFTVAPRRGTGHPESRPQNARRQSLAFNKLEKGRGFSESQFGVSGIQSGWKYVPVWGHKYYRERHSSHLTISCFKKHAVDVHLLKAALQI